jgi:hypothetical protein
MQQPPSAISERLRAIRRRVTVGVLATFVAAWLAVAALGKTGKSNASPDPATTAPQSTTDPYAQPYDDGGGVYDDGSGQQPYDDGAQQGFDDGGGQQSGGGSPQQPNSGATSPGPVQTQQS